MQRPGQPEEARDSAAPARACQHCLTSHARVLPPQVAACYVFLASEVDSGYMTGQVLHPNGGIITCG
jgi:hypothetical protein